MLIKDISRSLQLQTAHKLQAGRLAVRTHWFDRQIHAALTHAPSAAADGAGNQRQVVLLGAGMDTRPWRDLEYPYRPHGTHAFAPETPVDVPFAVLQLQCHFSRTI